MSTISIICEQAIFTSARGPTGEGYRIVAASPGIRAEEKQKITRCSPSHESLCVPEGTGAKTLVARPDAMLPHALRKDKLKMLDARSAVQRGAEALLTGAAFYPFPGGRFCVALSRHAGAEHSGRGGQCVHTHNVVFGAEELARCGYNAFSVVRAICALPPGAPTPAGGLMTTLSLGVQLGSEPSWPAESQALLPSGVRMSALQQLLERKSLVIDVGRDWLTWAEALLLAIPAPMRVQISFAAGLRFSTGRGHNLYLLRDEKGNVRSKAQNVLVLGSKSSSYEGQSSHWRNFVERHWKCDDLANLSRRTSRKFEDCSGVARERIAELFNSMDAIPDTEVTAVLDMAFRTLLAPPTGVEGEIRREFRDAALQSLKARFASMTWGQLRPPLQKLVEFWRRDGEAAAWAQPLIAAGLRSGIKADPAAAAELALSFAQTRPGADRAAHEAMLNEFFSQLLAMNVARQADLADRLAVCLPRWRAIRPDCPLIAELTTRLTPAPNAA